MSYSPEVIKAVLFDVAGVLTESYGHILLEAAEEIDANIELLAEVLLPIFLGENDSDAMGHKLERGEVSLEDFLDSLGPAEHDVRALLHPDSPYFFGHSLNPKREMFTFATELSKAGYRTGIISNSVREWEPSWDRAIPQKDIFDAVILSSQVGLRKPNPAIYRLAVDQLGITPDEAIFLDDFEPMVEGARRAGLHAVHVTDHEAAIRSVQQLLKL
jgi:putative hydrolase of the HAD superfamily